MGVPRADAFVYWTERNALDDHAIGRASLNGSVVDHAFISDPAMGGPCGVDVDSSHIYWANEIGGTIGRATLSGAGIDQDFIPGAGSPCGVVAGPQMIFWADTAGQIGSANIDGTGQGVELGMLSDPCGVALIPGAQGALFWADRNDDTIGRTGSGDTDPMFIENASSPCGVAVDSTTIYWANSGDGTIGRANLDGNGVDQGFIDGANGPCGVAVDGSHVYWANSGDGTIGRANLDGNGVDQGFIEDIAFNPCGVAVDLPSPPQPPAPPPVSPPLADRTPSNEFGFGRLKKNKKRGTAKLEVEVPGPGDVELAQSKKLKGTQRAASREGTVNMPIKPKGRAKRQLNQKGRAKAKAEVTYTPNGGQPSTQAKKLALKKK